MGFYKLTLFVIFFLLNDQTPLCSNIYDSDAISPQNGTDILIETPILISYSITDFQPYIMYPQRPQSPLFENRVYETFFLLNDQTPLCTNISYSDDTLIETPILVSNSITDFQPHTICPQRPQSPLYENRVYGLSCWWSTSVRQSIIVFQIIKLFMFCYLYSAPPLYTTFFWKQIWV